MPTPSRHFLPNIQNKMICSAFISKVPLDEHRDLSQFVLDLRLFTPRQLSQILSRLCMEINWDFFNTNIITFAASCADDASALGLLFPADTFEILWNEVLNVYQGHLKGLVVGGQGYDILDIVPRDRETGLVSTTALRMVGFMMGYFVGCRYGWVGDRIQAVVKALLEGGEIFYVNPVLREC